MADSTTNLAQVDSAQAQKEVTVNGLFDAASPATFGGRRAEACAGLVWGYYGGRWGGTAVANGTLTLAASATNYIVADRTTGAITLAEDSPSEWNQGNLYARLYLVVTGASAVTSYQDHRLGPSGLDLTYGATLANGDYGDIVVTGSGAVISIDSSVLSAFGRTLIDDTSASAARTTLGIAIGTDVQAYNANLTTWAGVTPGAGVATFLATPNSANLAAALADETGSGAAVFATSPTLVTPALGTPSALVLTNATGLPVAGGGTGAATAATARTNLGLAIGTDVQAYDADLATIAGLTATTDSFLQAKSSAWAARTVTQVLTDLQGDGLTVTMAGFRGIPQNPQSAAYTLEASDAGKCIYHPTSDTTARTWTIPANGSVAFPIGTAVTFDNDFGAGAITIAITTDTLVMVGTAGSTGSRTLASGGQATAIKVTSTRWRISGTGLS